MNLKEIGYSEVGGYRFISTEVRIIVNTVHGREEGAGLNIFLYFNNLFPKETKLATSRLNR